MGNKEKKPACWLIRLGVCGTVLYLAALSVWLWLKWEQSPDWARLRNIEINVLGDFLAGAFGPPAFLWLIFGYILQRRELQQNTEALRLQVLELRKSVEHQNVIARSTEEQLRIEADRRLEERRLARSKINPLFVFDNISDGGGIFRLNLDVSVKNDGGFCSDIEFLFSDNSWRSVFINSWSEGEVKSIRLSYSGNVNGNFPSDDVLKSGVGWVFCVRFKNKIGDIDEFYFKLIVTQGLLGKGYQVIHF